MRHQIYWQPQSRQSRRTVGVPDYTLITGGSATFALDGTSTATKFELHDAEVQKNFLTT